MWIAQGRSGLRTWDVCGDAIDGHIEEQREDHGVFVLPFILL
jgi:hypothetical protein